MSPEKMLTEKGIIQRHSFMELWEHWLLAISGFLLLFSGFGQMPIYKRYWITKIPGLQWSGNYEISLALHYVAAAVFIGVIIFHLLYHGLMNHRGLWPRRRDIKESVITIKAMLSKKEEPPFDKFLPEQRLAYIYMGTIIFVLILTGVLKVLKNFPGISLHPGVAWWATWLHTVATLLFIMGLVAHLAALLIKANRPLAKSIFHGRVDAEYVRKRHPYWFKELLSEKKEKEVTGC